LGLFAKNLLCKEIKMETKEKAVSDPSPIREVFQEVRQQIASAVTPVVRTHIVRRCEDCRVENAFHAWRDRHLMPSFNSVINFADWGIPPAGKRAVIELVTATISVPSGEWARLRMYTSLGSAPSNLDLALTPQGQTGGRQILVATHTLRVYSDHVIEFNINRDNPQTEGDALICISGFLIDV
jgi:hypothetical protein